MCGVSCGEQPCLARSGQRQPTYTACDMAWPWPCEDRASTATGYNGWTSLVLVGNRLTQSRRQSAAPLDPLSLAPGLGPRTPLAGARTQRHVAASAFTRSKPYELCENRKTSGGCSHSVQMVVMGVHAKELAS
jgi:hypothetical protein